jgi:hypothetical protein
MSGKVIQRAAARSRIAHRSTAEAGAASAAALLQRQNSRRGISLSACEARMPHTAPDAPQMPLMSLLTQHLRSIPRIAAAPASGLAACA